jgi:hypothetical protein
MRNVWFGASVASPPYGSFQWSGVPGRSATSVKDRDPFAKPSRNGRYRREVRHNGLGGRTPQSGGFVTFATNKNGGIRPCT